MESKAQRYRKRADDLRAIAAGLADAAARATLLDVAEDYERMAQAAEKPGEGKADGKDSGPRAH